jgi:hypothetical protein
MPYSIWKLVVSDLRELETLYVVQKDGKGWGKVEVDMALREAKDRFGDYLECAWGDEASVEEIEAWKLPEVRIVRFEDLVSCCWTSWD